MGLEWPTDQLYSVYVMFCAADLSCSSMTPLILSVSSFSLATCLAHSASAESTFFSRRPIFTPASLSAWPCGQRGGGGGGWNTEIYSGGQGGRRARGEGTPASGHSTKLEKLFIHLSQRQQKGKFVWPCHSPTSLKYTSPSHLLNKKIWKSNNTLLHTQTDIILWEAHVRGLVVLADVISHALTQGVLLLGTDCTENVVTTGYHLTSL